MLLHVILIATASSVALGKHSCAEWKRDGYCDSKLIRLRDHTRWLCPRTCGNPLDPTHRGYRKAVCKLSSSFEGDDTNEVLATHPGERRIGQFMCSPEPINQIRFAQRVPIYVQNVNPINKNSENPCTIPNGCAGRTDPKFKTYVGGNHLWVPMHHNYNYTDEICSPQIISAHGKEYVLKKFPSLAASPQPNDKIHGRYMIAIQRLQDANAQRFDGHYVKVAESISDGEDTISDIVNTDGPNWRARSMILPVFYSPTEYLSDNNPLNATVYLSGCEFIGKSSIANVPLILKCEHNEPHYVAIAFTSGSSVTINKFTNAHLDGSHVYYLFEEYMQSDKYHIGILLRNNATTALHPTVCPPNGCPMQWMPIMPRYHVVDWQENTNFISISTAIVHYYIFNTNDAERALLCRQYKPFTQRNEGKYLPFVIGATVFPYPGFKYPDNRVFCGNKNQIIVHYRFKFPYNEYVDHTNVDIFNDDDYTNCVNKPFYVLGVHIVICFPSQARDYSGRPIPVRDCTRQGGYYYKCISEAFTGLVYPGPGPMVPVAYPMNYGGWRKLYASPPDAMQPEFYMQYRASAEKYTKSVEELIVWGPLWSFIAFIVAVWILFLIYLLIALIISIFEFLTAYKKGQMENISFAGTYFVHCFISLSYIGYPGYTPAWFNIEKLNGNAHNAVRLHNRKWIALSYLAVFLFPLYAVVIIIMGILSLARIAKTKVKLE